MKCFNLGILNALIFVFFGCKSKNIELANFRGSWITKENDYLEIGDTTNKYSNSNYLGVKGNAQGKSIFLLGDTLSFQERYYSSETDYKKLYIERYDLKIISKNRRSLTVTPVSEESIKLFESRKSIKFIKQEHAIDEHIKFERIVFHTTPCYGSCPVFHLEINNSRVAKLHKEIVYTKDSKRRGVLDGSKIGFYEDKLNDEMYDGLIEKLRTCNLELLEFDGVTCCDGSIITVIVYFNGRKRYFKSMFPPQIASKLITQLYKICNEAELKRTENVFEFEK